MAGIDDIPDDDMDDIPAGSGGGRVNGDDHADESLVTLQNGIANGDALKPIQGRIHEDRQQSQAPVEFEIVETDENGRPLGEAPQRQDDTLQAQGDETYVDRQRQQPGEGQPGHRYATRAERRRAQQRSRQFNERQNAELKNELAQVKQQLASLAPRFQQFDASQRQAKITGLDNEINDAGRRFQEASAREVAAIRRMALGEDGAEAEYTKARKDVLDATVAGERATIAKSQLERFFQEQDARAGQDGRADRAGGVQDQRPQQQQQQDRPRSQREVRMQQDFLDRHAWIDPRGGDPASRTAIDIDRQIMAEGFDPSTAEYWSELEDRLAETFPHRFQSNGPAQNGNGQRQANGNGNGNGQRQQTQQRQQVQPQRRGPMTGGVEGGSPQRQRVMVSPQRKEALFQAGVIDLQGRVTNKEKYNRIMRGFADFDAEHRA